MYAKFPFRTRMQCEISTVTLDCSSRPPWVDAVPRWVCSGCQGDLTACERPAFSTRSPLRLAICTFPTRRVLILLTFERLMVPLHAFSLLTHSSCGYASSRLIRAVFIRPGSAVDAGHNSPGVQNSLRPELYTLRFEADLAAQVRLISFSSPSSSYSLSTHHSS